MDTLPIKGPFDDHPAYKDGPKCTHSRCKDRAWRYYIDRDGSRKGVCRTCYVRLDIIASGRNFILPPTSSQSYTDTNPNEPLDLPPNRT